jgi:serine/threonine protein kinase
MSHSSGSRLGPYEIQAPLGAGGMGEVYRASDTRLDRTVAVKILPEHISSPESRQRFDREARAISSLNHPNICHLYDVGQQDGAHYLVTEYLEGETLADRLRRGPLPFDQVLKIGTEICAGLEAAHKKGVIHRDLKPGNIMLTKSGAKLMDFGLAKPVEATAASTLTQTLTEPHHPLTVEGTLVGTLQYMSPETCTGRFRSPCLPVSADGWPQDWSGLAPKQVRSTANRASPARSPSASPDDARTGPRSGPLGHQERQAQEMRKVQSDYPRLAFLWVSLLIARLSRRAPASRLHVSAQEVRESSLQ